jgi:hypothetical protein
MRDATMPTMSSECARIMWQRTKGTHLQQVVCRSCDFHSLFRREAAHAAARKAEAALEAEKRAEQIKAAAAAVKQQQKADKSAAGTL